MTLCFQVSQFLCVAWGKELCQPVLFPFVTVDRKKNTSFTLLLAFECIQYLSKQANKHLSAPISLLFHLPMKAGKGSLGSGCTWMGQILSILGSSSKQNLAVTHARNVVFSMQLEAIPVVTVQSHLSTMPFNGTVGWLISELITVKTGEKRQIIPSLKFQSSTWVWGRSQFLRFHLFFWEAEV